MEKEVTEENIFEALILLHYRNLQASLPFLEKGQIQSNKNRPLIPGKSENPHYDGLYLVYDGERILKKASKRIMRDDGVRQSAKVSCLEDFFSCLCGSSEDLEEEDADQDKVFLYNTKGKVVYLVKGEFSNSLPKGKEHSRRINDLLQYGLPANFLSEDLSRKVTDCGTKTANALLTAYALNHKKDLGVRTIIIKRTAYGQLGMGKLAEFGSDGLIREFYFEYNPHHQGTFIDEKSSIVGVYKHYSRDATGALKPDLVNYVSISRGGDVRYFTPRVQRQAEYA
jgi:hypothetical protein